MKLKTHMNKEIILDDVYYYLDTDSFERRTINGIPVIGEIKRKKINPKLNNIQNNYRYLLLK